MDLFAALMAEPLQLLIPLISGVIGWVTNVLAVKMMFQPTEFVGIKPFLGWQGIVPANAIRLANTGVKLVTDQLLDVIELFSTFDPKAFVAGQRDDLRAMTEKVVSDKAAARFPGMWNALAPGVKDQVITLACNEVEGMTERVLEDATGRIDELLDVTRVVMAEIEQDKELMGRIFRTVGSAEFVFIERSGLYFGFLFGLVQLVVWIAYPAFWILPFFGFLVGYATNWLALKLIFDPKEPLKVGPFTVQGLFHRRQKAISKEFATIMTGRVLTPDNLFRELSTGRSREILLEIVQKHGDALVGQYENHPMLGMVLKGGAHGEEAEALKAEILAEVEQEMFRPGGFLYSFSNKSDEIRTILLERMSEMEAEAYEGVLRPAFKQDEWKLILAGAVLGLGAGFAQLVFLFGDMVLE